MYDDDDSDSDSDDLGAYHGGGGGGAVQSNNSKARGNGGAKKLRMYDDDDSDSDSGDLGAYHCAIHSNDSNARGNGGSYGHGDYSSYTLIKERANMLNLAKASVRVEMTQTQAVMREVVCTEALAKTCTQTQTQVPTSKVKMLVRD
jgi:hypothetical protein